jgi:DNA-binding NtrC family response regulator
MEVELALIVCKEGTCRDRVALAAGRCGLSPICCRTLREARSLLVQEEFRMVLCEDLLPDGDFYMALREVKITTRNAPLIVLSQNADWGAYLKALTAGVFDWILCPASLSDSEQVVRCALLDSAQRTAADRMAA